MACLDDVGSPRKGAASGGHASQQGAEFDYWKLLGRGTGRRENHGCGMGREQIETTKNAFACELRREGERRC